MILLSVDAEVPGVLPHRLDDTTEFEESFEYLKKGEDAPDFRALEEIETVEEVGYAGVVTEQVCVEAGGVVDLEVSSNPSHMEVSDEPSVVAEEVLDRAPAIVLKQSIPENVEVVFERDWSGVVLVPDLMKLAKAYTSDVRLARIEAHPIDGERLRVWARIQNITDAPMNVEIGCEFRSGQYSMSDRAQFEATLIPAGGFVEKQFVSTQDRVASYTLMVKRGN